MAAYVGVAGDFNPLIIDQTYAEQTSFGGTVVPGTLIAAVAVGLGSLDVPLPATAGMVGTSWRFLQPVRPGDSVETTWRLNRKRPVGNPNVGLCFWQIEVINQHGAVVATGEVGRLVRRRQPAPLDKHHEVEEAGAAGQRSRRRRRRSGSPERDRAAEIVESQPVPEPAPADAPSPARRRRRRRGNNGQPGAPVPPEGAAPAPSAPPVPVTTAHPPPAVTEGSRTASSPAAGRGLRGVLRRLRGT